MWTPLYKIDFAYNDGGNTEALLTACAVSYMHAQQHKAGHYFGG